MQLSIKQILASSAAAMLAALIASAFGEKGTIIGVAIGSIVATVATVLIARSVDRAHRVVKLVVQGEGADLLRRMGATSPAGEVTHSDPEEGAQASEQTAVHGDVPEPQTEPLPAVPSGARDPAVERPIRWRLVALAMGGAFLLALVVVTSIELIAGRPISSIFGSNTGNEPSIGQIFNPAVTTTVPPTTTTSSTSTTTTSSTTPSTTTTTGSSTTTTQPLLNLTGTTTTTSSTSSTTTTVPSTTTTTSVGSP